MANTATAQEFYNGMLDRAVGTPDSNALDILIGTGHAFSLDITGTPTGGTFKLTFGEQETAAIAYDANAAAVDSAITALSNVGASDVAVTGTNPNFEIVFSGDSRFTREELTLSDNSFTGGTSPSATIAVIAASDNTFLSAFETLATKAAAEFSDDREEDVVIGEIMSHLWDAAAAILANVRQDMARKDITLDTILDAVRDKLVANIADATEPNCFVSMDPLELYNGRPGDFYYVVSPDGGVFDESLIDGGGQNQVTDDTRIAITIHSIQNLDRPDEDHIFLTHRHLGLIPRFKQVLKTMVAADLQDSAGDDITFEPVMPKSYNIGRERGENPTGWIQLVLSVKFDWDLS